VTFWYQVRDDSKDFHWVFRQRDEFGQEFFGTRHGFRVAQASSL
jgi:hypothetical protein